MSELKQEQSNIMNVGEHGRFEEIECDYLGKGGLYTYSRVKVLLYQGEITRVMCVYFKKGSCQNSYNETKSCYIFEN